MQSRHQSTIMAGVLVMIFSTGIALSTYLPIRACPEEYGACVCNSTTRSVICNRLGSLNRKLPVGIPVNTRHLIVQHSTLQRLGHAAFRNCYYLEKVDLSKNRLEDISPYAFHRLSRLSSLNLAGNRIRFLTEDTFLHLQNLKILNLSENRFIVLAPFNFEKLKKLEQLYIKNNPVMCMAPTAFSGLYHLNILMLSDMTSDLPENLLNDLTNLRVLGINRFKNVHTIPQYFLKNNNKLQVIRFENIPLTNGLSGSFFTGLTALNTLSLQACNLSAIPIRLLHHIKKSLVDLDLSGNHFSVIKENDFMGLQRLKKLSLERTNLIKIEPRAFALPSLKTVDISSNRLTALNPNVFIEHGVRYINLGNNPWICDCDLKWIMTAGYQHESGVSAVCAEPPSMQTFDITSVYNITKLFPCEAPNITQFGIIKSDDPNNNITLTVSCEVSGYPIPQLRWVIPEQDLVGTEQIMAITKNYGNNKKCFVCKPNSHHPERNMRVNADGSLELLGLSNQFPNGVYTCRASNRFGVVERNMLIYDSDRSSKRNTKSVRTSGVSFSEEMLMPPTQDRNPTSIETALCKSINFCNQLVDEKLNMSTYQRGLKSNRNGVYSQKGEELPIILSSTSDMEYKGKNYGNHLVRKVEILWLSIVIVFCCYVSLLY